MLTCKEFLDGLNDYLDETLEPELYAKLQRHVTECPNCWVIVDTTKKTIRVYKGMEPHTLPADVHERLMRAVQRKVARGLPTS